MLLVREADYRFGYDISVQEKAFHQYRVERA